MTRFKVFCALKATPVALTQNKSILAIIVFALRTTFIGVSVIWASDAWFINSFIGLHDLSSDVALVNITFPKFPGVVFRISRFFALLTKLLNVVHLRFQVAQLVL